MVALCKGVETMSKWKRKKYQENQVDTGEEEFSPLGLALLEQFAAGVSVPCLSNNYLDVFFVNVHQTSSFH